MTQLDRCRTSFAAQGFLATLGATLAALEAGRCTIEAPVTPGLSQQHGMLHGGAIATLADVACGYAAMSMLPEGGEVLSVEFKLNFLRPGAGAVAIARAEVIKPGRTLTTCRADVVMRDAEGRETLCATMLATMMAAMPEARTTSVTPAGRATSVTPAGRAMAGTPASR